MKLFKYNQFINESNEYIDSICKEYGIRNYTINFDGSIDVNGDVHLLYKGLTKLPIKFNNVSGYFNCYSNQLTSLEGAPKSVGEYFSCNSNQLTSLEGCPKSVGGYFSCSENKLTDFYGFPEDWEGSVNFFGNTCQKILNLFPAEKWCSVIDLLNEFEVIQGRKISEVRMEEVFRQLRIKFPENLYIDGYEII